MCLKLEDFWKVRCFGNLTEKKSIDVKVRRALAYEGQILTVGRMNTEIKHKVYLVNSMGKGGCPG